MREFRYWLTNYRRTWRGSVISSVLGPVLYLSAMGAGLGTLVNRHSAASLGGVTYLAFISPGLLAATAMQTAFGEGMYPVLGSVKWVQNYFAAAAGPLRPADVFRGHLMFVTLRLVMNCGIFLAVIAAFGAVRSPLVILTLPGGGADRAGVRAGTDGVGGDPDHRRQLRRADAVRDGAVVPVLRHVLPDQQLPGWLHPVAYVTPLWHGVALCRSLALGPADLGGAAVHVGYLLASGAAGCVFAERTYRRRLNE